MANIFGGKIPPTPVSARRLNYKVGLASDLSVGEGGQRGYHSKRKYCTKKKNKNPQNCFYGRRVFSLGNATLKTYKALATAVRGHSEHLKI